MRLNSNVTLDFHSLLSIHEYNVTKFFTHLPSFVCKMITLQDVVNICSNSVSDTVRTINHIWKYGTSVNLSKYWIEHDVNDNGFLSKKYLFLRIQESQVDRTLSEHPMYRTAFIK